MSPALNSTPDPAPLAPLASPVQAGCIVPFALPARAPAVPDEDRVEFACEAPPAQREVRFWLAIISEILDAGKPRGAAITKIARRHSLSGKTVATKFYAWSRSGDWRALINRSKHRAPSDITLPPAFVEHWRAEIDKRVGRQHGKIRAAHRSLCLRLAAWERGCDDSAIPGYSSPPPRQLSTGLPAGWVYESLARRAQSQAERRLIDHGPKAYSALMPSNRTTRVGMEVGEEILFDDQENDVEVVFDLGGHGTGQIMRPLAFHALDGASACDFTRGFKPQIIDPLGVRRKLTEADFLWFVIHVLTNYGYRADRGTRLIVEHGTAAIKADFEQCLYDATGGKVRVDRSGRFGDPAFRSMMFRGPGSGNFRFKAARESWFNILRIEMAALPGQVGAHRDISPEEREGANRYTRWLLKTAETLPAERRMLLMLPKLAWSQFVTLANDLSERINTRVDHECEGWEASGYIANEFTTDSQRWLPCSLLTDPRLGDLDRARMLAAMAIPGHCRPRRMSPREVFDAGAPRLTRIPDHQISTLIPERFATDCRVNDQLTFILSDQNVQPEPLLFIAEARNHQGHEIKLRRGETYLLYFNPYQPDRVQVCEAHGSRRGAWIGTCHRFIPAAKGDREAILENFGHIRHAVASERAAAERRAGPIMFGRQAMKNWNERVLDLKTALTPDEHTHDQLHRDATTALESAFLHDDPTTPPEPTIPDAWQV